MARDKTKISGKKPKKVSKSKLQDTKLIIALCVVLAIIAGGATFFLIQRTIQTETYYVLSEDIGPRTLIQPEQMTPVVAREGSAPPNALNIADIQTGSMFTQYPLRAGDIVTMSTVGALEDISVGIPENWVVTSFGASANNAVGGRIQRGSYFDIVGLDEDDNAFYIFQNVMALDTTVSTEGLSSADAIDTEEAQAGQTEQYFVGMSPQNNLLLHSALRQYDIKLVLSPRQNDYLTREEILESIEEMDRYYNYNPDDVDPQEVGTMTDSSFRPVDRDDDGRPIAWDEDGNEIPADELIDDSDQVEGSGSPQESSNTPSEPDFSEGNVNDSPEDTGPFNPNEEQDQGE